VVCHQSNAPCGITGKCRDSRVWRGVGTNSATAGCTVWRQHSFIALVNPPEHVVPGFSQSLLAGRTRHLRTQRRVIEQSRCPLYKLGFRARYETAHAVVDDKSWSARIRHDGRNTRRKCFQHHISECVCAGRKREDIHIRVITRKILAAMNTRHFGAIEVLRQPFAVGAVAHHQETEWWRAGGLQR